MEERDLLFLAKLVTLAGLILLFVLATFMRPPKLEFGDNNLGPMESDTRIINGKITDITVTPKSTQIRVSVEINAEIIVFDTQTNFVVGDVIEARGSIQNDDDYVLFADSITITES